MLGLTRSRPVTEPAEPRRRRFGHPGWTIASLIFVALLVAAGIFVAVVGDGEHGEEAAPQAAAPTSSAPAEPSGPVEADGAFGCPSELPAEDQSLPVDPPAAEWRTVGRVDAPFAVEHGPVLQDGGVFRCFARTPTGALFAAANFLASVTDAARLERAVTDLTAPGLGQDRLAALAATNPVAITGSGTPYAIAGYTFLSTGLDTVAVSVVLTGESGGRVAVPVSLSWDGDWQVLLPDDGNLTRLATPVQSLTGFTPWQAP